MGLTNNGFDKAVTPGREAAEFPMASGKQALQLQVSERDVQAHYIMVGNSGGIAIIEGVSITLKAIAEP